MFRILIVEDDPRMLIENAHRLLEEETLEFLRCSPLLQLDLSDEELLIVEIGAGSISIDPRGDVRKTLVHRSMLRSLTKKKPTQHNTERVEPKPNQALSCLEGVVFSKQNRRRRLAYSDRRLLRRWGEWQFLRERVLFFSELGLLCACTIAVILIVGGYYATATQVSVIALGGLAGAALRHLAKSGI